MTLNKLLVIGALLFLATPAFALTAGTAGALPWDAALTTFRTSVTGPYAFTAAVAGMVIAGSILIFGNDLNRFGQSMLYLVLVIGLIILGVNGMAGLFTTGATVAAATIANLSIAVLLAGSVAISVIQMVLITLIKRCRREPTLSAVG